MPLSTANFDVIVVGAGSAGCALAARLSENGARRVLLVEAGPHYRDQEAWPADLLQGNTFAATLPGAPHNWSFSGTLLPGRTYPIPRGKVVGGSSAVNGTYFIRGRPEDFDAWAQAGLAEWSWDAVLPFYRRCEHDLDVDGPLHGSDGPVPVRRAPPQQWRPVTAAFVQACRTAGFPEEHDKNGLQPPGAGPIPRNCIDGLRMNTAITHLTAALERPNFTLRARALVRRVLFEGQRAAGIEVDWEGERTRWWGGEIVLCAGGIGSPHLLMLSGIGDAARLREHGIEAVHHNPQVGQQLMDHLNVTLPFRIEAEEQPLPPDFMPIQACLNFTTPGSSRLGESQISCVAASMSRLLRQPDAQPGAKRVGLKDRLSVLRGLAKVSPQVLLSQLRTREDLQLNYSLMLPHGRGQLALHSADAAVPPAIDFNYLSDPRDRRTVREGVRCAAALLREPALRELGAHRSALDDAELADDDRLDSWIRATLGTAFHTSCTARMGPAGDPAAAVDSRGRVHGVTGLRVADLSICPTIVRRGTSATAVMIGERMAALMD